MAFRLVILLAMAAVGASSAAVTLGSGADGGVTAASPTRGDETGTPIVDCESRLAIIPPRNPTGSIDPRVRRVSVLAEPVLFAGAKRWRKAPRKLFTPKRPGGLPGAKIPIYVRANREVTVTALPPAGHRALLSVALDRGHARGASVTLRSCPEDAEVVGLGGVGRPVGPWTDYRAGFKVDAPMCVGIEVEADGTTGPITRSIAFGRKTRRTCPGRS